MKIVFLNISQNFLFSKINHPQHILPQMDIGYCSSVLENNNHKTSLIDTALGGFKLDQIIKLVKNKDAVVIKTPLNLYKLTLKLVEQIKNLGIPIILIGPIATMIPSAFLFKNSQIDFCVFGEPEYSLSELINNLENGNETDKIKGIAFYDNGLKINESRPLINKLDELPFPNHSFFIRKGYNFYYPLFVKKKRNMGFILSSRGCPFNCIFCSPFERVSYGKNYRARSTDNVVDEIEFLSSKGVNGIYFLDDLFTFDKKRVIDICEEILKRKIQINWAVQSRVNTIDKEMLIKMKKSGCSTICFGIESGSEQILKIINKKINLTDIRKTVKLTKNVGINTVGFFIIGSPTESLADMNKTLQLTKELPFNMIQVSFFTPYPGSQAYNKFQLKTDFEKFDMNNLPTSLSNFSTKSLIVYQKYFYKQFYLNQRFLRNYFLRFFYSFFNINDEIRLLKNAIDYVFD